jgi:hypothetical protein
VTARDPGLGITAKLAVALLGASMVMGTGFAVPEIMPDQLEKV